MAHSTALDDSSQSRVFPSHALIFGGSGDTGERLTEMLHDRGVEVVITTRSDPDELQGEPWSHVEIEPWNGAGALERLERILEMLDERSRGDWVAYNLIGAWLTNPEEAILETVETLIEGWSTLDDPVRLIHCSATSVYGDRPGDVLDESSSRSPELKVGRLHARAEDALMAAKSSSLEPYILRLPHIYGPDRERTVDMMCRGEFAVAGDGSNNMHHIYIRDLVRILAAAATADRPEPPVLNVVDDEAAPYGDYCDWIAEACGHDPLERITFEEARQTGYWAERLGPHMEHDEVLEAFYGYMTSSAVIDNHLMKETLDLDLEYPSYREGLREMLEQRNDVPDPPWSSS